MHRDVIGFVTLDLVLRIVRARVMGVTLVVGVFLMHLGDFAAHKARFGIPAHVIAYLKSRGHANNSSSERAKSERPRLRTHLLDRNRSFTAGRGALILLPKVMASTPLLYTASIVPKGKCRAST